MDFGLDKVVDMGEARFGRAAGTALLALIGIAAAGLAVRIIVIDIILPSWKVGSAIYAWTQTIHIPVHFPTFKSPAWPEVGYYAYGCFASVFSLFIVESDVGATVQAQPAGTSFFVPPPLQTNALSVG